MLFKIHQGYVDKSNINGIGMGVFGFQRRNLKLIEVVFITLINTTIKMREQK
jgi:hypothetical protein